MAVDLRSVIFDAPQTNPPEQFSFAIGLEQADREKFAKEYGNEIERALQARRSGFASSYQWIGDADTATKATRVTDPGRPQLKSWEDEIQDNWARYEMLPPDRMLPFDGAANYRTPLTKWIVDSILARIIAGLATVRPVFRVEAAQSVDDMARGGRVEEFLDYSLEHELDFVPWLDSALQSAAVEGAAIGYLTWQNKVEHRLVEELQERMEVVKDPATDQPMPDGLGGFVQKRVQEVKIVEREDVVESRPNLDLIPFVDFLVADPRRRRLSDQPWMGHRTRLYRAELVQLKGQEGYFDEEIQNLLDGAGNVSTGPSTDKVEQGVEQRTGVATGSTATPSMKMLDTFDIWPIIAWYDWDQDGKPERVVAEIAMPQKRLIRLIKFPYLHNRPFYIPIMLLPRSNSFMPRALVGDLKMTQDELDAMTNQRSDATAIAIACLFMFLYDDQAGFDPSKVRIGLGESIKVSGDINHIQSLAKAFRGVQVPGMDVVNYLLEMARQLSGIHEMQTGGTDSKRATAFEIGAVIQEGNVKFRRMIERVAIAMAEIAYQVIALYQQHANRVDPKVYKVLNDPENPFRTLEPGELAGRWNYRVHGMAIASQRDLDARKAMEMLQIVEQSTVLQEFLRVDPRRRYHLARVFLDKLGWPVEDIIGKEEQIPQVMGAQAAQAQQERAGRQVPPEVERMVQEMMGRGGAGEAPPQQPQSEAGQAGAEAVQEGTGL